MLFETSSVIKVAVILSTLDALVKNKSSLNTELVIEDRHLSRGSGVIAWTNWRRLTIYQLITCIDRYSDCSATNCLIEFSGGFKRINHYLATGYPKTRLRMANLQFTDRESVMPQVGVTTVREMSELSEKLLVRGPYSKHMRAAFKKVYAPWYGYKINTTILGCKKLYIKTGSMKMIGEDNDCALNFTGVIVDRTGTYSFCSLNRVQLGPDASDTALTRATDEIAYNFISQFTRFKRAH